MPTNSALVRGWGSLFTCSSSRYSAFSRYKTGKCRRKIRIKTLSLGVVIPDITFHLAKENAQMALFSPYDVERVYGKPFADVAISERYDELVADERIRKNTSTPVISSSDWQKSSLSPAIPTSCMKTRLTVLTLSPGA